MKTLTAFVFLLAACDASESPVGSRTETTSGAPSASWRPIDCPSWRTNSGLFRISDPIAGNTVYLHLGSAESSVCVVPGATGPAGYKEIKCPYYGTNSGLFSIADPDNGNIIYLHIGSKESSLFVMQPKGK